MTPCSTAPWNKPISEVEIERFWSRVDKSSPDGCWPWTQSRNPKGYGRFQWGVRERHQIEYSHRLAFWLEHGWLPTGRTGLLILHSCDNPCCCNPRHLRAGDARENMADAISRNRLSAFPRPQGEANPASKLRERDVQNIHARVAAGETRTAIAADLGVAICTVARVSNGETWKSAFVHAALEGAVRR